MKILMFLIIISISLFSEENENVEYKKINNETKKVYKEEKECGFVAERVSTIIFEGTKKEFDDLYKCNTVGCENKETKESLDGDVIINYENGNVKVENKFKQGKLHGISKEYDESGNIKSKGEFNEGNPVKITRYYENGNIKSEKTFLTKGIKYVEYDEQGNIIK